MAFGKHSFIKKIIIKETLCLKCIENEMIKKKKKLETEL